MWEGGGVGVGWAQCLNNIWNIFVHPPCLKQVSLICMQGWDVSWGQGEWGVGGGCSVTLVADWRKLIFIIQTDGALSEFVLWDDLTLLGSSVLRVSHESGGGGRG